MQNIEAISLPCQPRVIALLSGELLHNSPNLQRIVQLFGSDPVLAASLMSHSNISTSHGKGLVCGIPQAIAMLSIPQLRILVRHSKTCIELEFTSAVELEIFWRNSITMARLARRLAGIKSMDGSIAYAAGLMHGIGALYLQSSPKNSVVLLDKGSREFYSRCSRLEEKCRASCATKITAHLLSKWNLPHRVIKALEHMENPLDLENFEPISGILHLAMWRTRTLAKQWNERCVALSFPTEVGVALGIDMNVVLQKDGERWG